MNKKETWSLEEKAGLADKDLNEEPHSEICLWFNKKENQIKVLKETNLLPSDIKDIYYLTPRQVGKVDFSEYFIKQLVDHCAYRTSSYIATEYISGETKEEVEKKIKNRKNPFGRKIDIVNVNGFKTDISVAKKEEEWKLDLKPEDVSKYRYCCNKLKKICSVMENKDVIGESILYNYDIESICELHKKIIDSALEVKQKAIKRKPEDFFLFCLKWEEPIKNGNYIIGYPDFNLDLRFIPDYNDLFKTEVSIDCIENFIIEVKPKISLSGENSVGKVMRQMKTYGSYSKKQLIIITKTPDFKDIFEEQGISYYVFKE